MMMSRWALALLLCSGAVACTASESGGDGGPGLDGGDTPVAADGDTSQGDGPTEVGLSDESLTDNGDETDGGDLSTETTDVLETTEIGDTAEDLSDVDGQQDTATDVPDGGDAHQEVGETDVLEVPPNECAADGDCAADENACTFARCLAAEDGHLFCDAEDVVCEASDICLVSACDAKDGCVESFEASPSCCFQQIHGTYDFEGTDENEVQVSNQAIDGTPEATWTLVDTRSYTGASSYYFGIPEQLNYDNGKLVAADIEFPGGWVDDENPAELVFHLWLDLEEGGSWDVLILSAIAEDGTSTPIWVKTYDNVAMGQWQKITVGLDAFAGQSIGWRFSFNSVDHTFNDGEGIYLDAVWFWTGCDSFQCNVDTDCDDGIACTADTCVEGACAYDTAAACCVADADCFDGDHCTVDACLSFACENVPVANPECCNTDAECDDSNDCTIDSCDPDIGYECIHPIDLANELCCEEETHCDDNDTCTIDTCNDGICGWVNTCCFSDEECNDFDDICTVDSCVAGACVYALQDIAGCCEPEPLIEDFEGGLGGWSFAGGSGGCKWQVTGGGQAQSGSQALYYGNPIAWNFDCGVSSGTATSTDFDLQDGVGYHLKASIYMDTEGSPTYDQLRLAIVSDDGVETVWTKPFVSTNQWFDIDINMNAWAGHSVSFRWTFNTIDSLINYGQGTFVDDMLLTSTCAPVPCQSNAECDDGLGGTTQSCAGGSCIYGL
jgi:hypothetical protein